MNNLRFWKLVFVLSICVSINYVNAQKSRFGNPQAEWARAGVILMHTPGQELFDGLLHPAAGLFADYFDVDKAAAEHENYIKMLRKNGIKVYTILDILEETGIDSVRELASKSMIYNTKKLDKEDAEEAEKYRQEVLSKMSRADLIRCIIFQPTVILYKTGQNTGYEAQYSHVPMTNLHFTRDQSVSTPRGYVICNLNSSQRDIESDIIELCYRHLGQNPILRIQDDGRLEGGDYIPAGTISLIGCGMRTNDEGIRQMMAADAFGHDTVVVVRDHKFWQQEMHLNTYFNIIDKDLCTLSESRLNARPDDPEFLTCDIWTRQPGTKEYTIQRSRMPFVSFLDERNFEIIPIGSEDEEHYANNYLTIAPRHIMAVDGLSKELLNLFSGAGVKVESVPMDNLVAGFGAANSLTQVMKRSLRW